MNVEELAQNIAANLKATGEVHGGAIDLIAGHIAHALLSGELGIRILADDEVGVGRFPLGVAVFWLEELKTTNRLDAGQLRDVTSLCEDLSAALKEGE